MEGLHLTGYEVLFKNLYPLPAIQSSIEPVAFIKTLLNYEAKKDIPDRIWRIYSTRQF